MPGFAFQPPNQPLQFSVQPAFCPPVTFEIIVQIRNHFSCNHLAITYLERLVDRAFPPLLSIHISHDHAARAATSNRSHHQRHGCTSVDWRDIADPRCVPARPDLCCHRSGHMVIDSRMAPNRDLARSICSRPRTASSSSASHSVEKVAKQLQDCRDRVGLIRIRSCLFVFSDKDNAR